MFFLIKFKFITFNKTALFIAIEKESSDIVQLLLANKNINVNLKSISIVLFEYHFNFCLILFEKKFFNQIQILFVLIQFKFNKFQKILF